MRRSVLVLAVVAVAVTGCTSGGTVGSSGTVVLSSASATARPSSAGPTTTGSPTPVTPNGLTTGPGVTASTIRLGLLVDPTRDRGFSDGARLWTRAVNAAGGVCGRTIALVSASGVAGYRDHAPGVLGFAAEPAVADVSTLDTLVAADQVPVLQASGPSSALAPGAPVVLGATDDIAAANGLAFLLSSGRLAAHATVGVLSDGSADAVDALAGARWWAARNDITLVERSSDATAAVAGAAALLVLAGPAVVDRALSATSVPVLTTVDGYDPATVPAADAARLLVVLATPAFGSDQPAAAAVSEAAYAAGLTDPGPRLLSGYAVGTTWGRLLQRACTDLALTRAGIATAMTTVGPAAVDSLLGPSDPGLVVASQLPATRQSSVAQAAPNAPGGLKPLVWMVAAPGIEDYAAR